MLFFNFAHVLRVANIIPNGRKLGVCIREYSDHSSSCFLNEIPRSDDITMLLHHTAIECQRERERWSISKFQETMYHFSLRVHVLLSFSDFFLQKHATYTSKKVEDLDSPAKRIHTLHATVLVSCCCQCKRSDSFNLTVPAIFPRKELTNLIVDFHLVGTDRPSFTDSHFDPSNNVSIDIVRALMRSSSLSKIRSSDRIA